MKTGSIMVQTLCTPCACRCRYCLLSTGEGTVGADWGRSVLFARRFIARMEEERPGTKLLFTFGYSMEHPDLRGALRVLRELNSPQAEFLQCDGMRMRDEAECAGLARMLAEEGVKHLNFTFYGDEEYHDSFARRRGDRALMLRMIRAAGEAGLELSVGMPLTRESAPMAEGLANKLGSLPHPVPVRFFVPHSEGRGITMEGARLRESDLALLPGELLPLLNRSVYRTEAEWLSAGLPEENGRQIIVSLRKDNIERYEVAGPRALTEEIEALDEAYYAAFPPAQELAERYGDREGELFFSSRDLFARYRRMFSAEFGVRPYDVMDERQSGSRRYRTEYMNGDENSMETKAYRYITLRERPELMDAAAEWFCGKWHVPKEAYLECMEAYLSGGTELGWYLCLFGDEIVGGLGAIENDFHDRKDLSPNICAVYTEPQHRCRGIAGRLLNLAVEDLRGKGISPVYLLTDHTGFYERYGWEFFCPAQGDGEEEPSRLYIHY